MVSPVVLERLWTLEGGDPGTQDRLGCSAASGLYLLSEPSFLASTGGLSERHFEVPNPWAHSIVFPPPGLSPRPRQVMRSPSSPRNRRVGRKELSERHISEEKNV